LKEGICRKSQEFLAKFMQIYCGEVISFLILLSETAKSEVAEVIFAEVKELDRQIFGGNWNLADMAALLTLTAGNEFICLLTLAWGRFEIGWREDWKSVQTIFRILSLSRFYFPSLKELMNERFLGTKKEPFGYVHYIQIDDICLD
jgi:hypothetical protein